MNEIATVTPRPEDDAPGSLMNFVAMALQDPAIDVTKLDALLRMQREIVSDQAKVAFNKALHAAQADMPRVPKNGIVKLGEGKGSYNFAKWEDVDKLLRPIMTREGFTLSFDMAPRPDGGGAIVTGTLLHAAGHSRSASIPLALDAGFGRNNLQAMGSTLSYGKRYLAEMFFNIVREGADDDGTSGGKQYISQAQYQQLVDLLDDTKTNLDRFFAVMGVDAERLDAIEAKDFPRLVNALEQKKRQQAEKAGREQGQETRP